MSQLFQCPSCNAPLEYDGLKSLVGCPYCGNNVIVPETLRPRQPAPEPEYDDRGYPFPQRDVLSVLETIQQMAKSGQVIPAIRLYRGAFGVGLKEARDAVQSLAAGNTINPPRMAAPFGRVYTQNPEQTLASYQQTAVRGGCLRVFIILALAGAIIAAVLFFVLPTNNVQQQLDTIPQLVQDVGSTFEIPVFPTASPTPGFATQNLRWGSEGVGPGRFDDARGIALNQSGNVYVGEYSTGRIQVFDEAGKFLTQWTVPGPPYLDNFAVSREGVLVIPMGGNLEQFAANNGQPFGPLPINDEGSVEDTVVAMPDGGWVTMIDDDIVRLNASGDVILRIEDAFEKATGTTEMLPILAADGLGNIYALGRFANLVLKFAPDGRYLTRFGGEPPAGSPDAPGTLQAPISIAVDGTGRVLVGDIFGVKVFDSEGRHLDIIDTDNVALGIAIHDNGDIFTAERDHVAVYEVADQQ